MDYGLFAVSVLACLGFGLAWMVLIYLGLVVWENIKPNSRFKQLGSVRNNTQGQRYEYDQSQEVSQNDQQG